MGWCTMGGGRFKIVTSAEGLHLLRLHFVLQLGCLRRVIYTPLYVSILSSILPAYLNSDCHNCKARASALAEPHLQHHQLTSFNHIECASTMADTAMELEVCKAAAEVCGMLLGKISSIIAT
jgi:hypothetical protein